MNAETRSWVELSRELAAMVRSAARSVVRVDGGRRGPSSGVVWAADGTIVAPSHGLDDDEVEIGLPSGETVAAEVAGRDPSTDLAVLRARVNEALVPAIWSDDALEVGQLVFSVTRPGRGPRAGAGLVSRLGDAWRTSAGGKLDRYVELELEVHSGFSGGLVLDAGGSAIGVAAAGLVRGAPLAIPSPTLTRVVSSLLAHGAVRRGYLGIATLPVRVPAPVAQRASPGQEAALLVTAVEDGGPAARAGLLVGDLLLAIDGRPIERMTDLVTALDEERIGTSLHVRVVRAGDIQETEITVGTRADARGGDCR